MYVGNIMFYNIIKICRNFELYIKKYIYFKYINLNYIIFKNSEKKILYLILCEIVEFELNFCVQKHII